MRNPFPWIAGLLSLTLGTAMLSYPGLAADRPAIAFADLGGIRDWRPGPGESLLVQSLNRKWYRVTFFGSCPEIRFTDTVAFVTEPNGSLDRFSSILVEGRRCWFRTFSEITDPEALERLEAKPETTAPELE